MPTPSTHSTDTVNPTTKIGKVVPDVGGPVSTIAIVLKRDGKKGKENISAPLFGFLYMREDSGL